MGAVDKNEQIAHLNKTRCHYRWPCRLFMKFLVWAAYNAYIIMDSYRPHSRAGHCFHTFHMFVAELCLQLVGDYRTAVHLREARVQQSDLLRLQGVGQHHPERSPAATLYRIQMPLRTAWPQAPVERGPCRAARYTPTVEPPHTVCFSTTHASENRGPVPLPGRGAEAGAGAATRQSGARPRPPGGAGAPAKRQRLGGAARHVPERQHAPGPSGARARPARGLQLCMLAGPPAPGAGVGAMRSGRPACTQLVGHGCAHWSAGPRQAPRAGVVGIRGLVLERAPPCP